MLSDDIIVEEFSSLLACNGPRFTFRVIGIPASKGSKNARVIRNSGKNSSSNLSGKKFGPRAYMYETDKNLPAWKEVVEMQARRAIPADWTFAPKDKQIYLLLILLYFQRPGYHYNKNQELLPKYRDLKYKGTKLDADKCVRAIGDVLSGLAYADDAQVVAPFAAKLYCPPGRLPGALVSVRRIVTV